MKNTRRQSQEILCQGFKRKTLHVCLLSSVFPVNSVGGLIVLVGESWHVAVSPGAAVVLKAVTREINEVSFF